MIFKLLMAIIKHHTELKKYRKELNQLTGVRSVDLVKYCCRLYTSRSFWKHIKKSVTLASKKHSGEAHLGGWIDYATGTLIYCLIRHRNPFIIVETGVGAGGSSAFILKGLSDNGNGTLYSIDLPGHDAVVYPKIGKAYDIQIPEGLDVGWLVPPELKARWKLTIGDSKVELPKLVSGIGRIDIFMHDSLHTDEHILFEFKTILSHMTDRGFFLCDDVGDYWSTAFIKFCEEVDVPCCVFLNRLGVAPAPKKER